MRFGDRVKKHREEILELSMRDAGADIGVSAATLSRVEQCRTPDIFTLAKLCRWMGLSVEQALIDLGVYSGKARHIGLKHIDPRKHRQPSLVYTSSDGVTTR